jgi:superfamily II DNA or RNA helicase
MKFAPCSQKISKKFWYALRQGAVSKTVIFSFIAAESSKRNKRILILSHRIELLSQSGGTLEQFGIKPILITPETKKPQDAPVSVAMVMTLKNRLKHEIWKDWFSKLDLIIIDECHRSDFSWIKVDCFKLGVTASPKRSGKMPQLSSEYDRMVCGPDTQDLVNMGRLMPDRYFGVQVDISDVGIGNDGEFDSNQLFSKYNKTELYSGVIDNWKRICPNTITICFCVNIQHCIETAKAFNEAGIKAKFVTSDVAKPIQGEGISGKILYERKLKEFENYNAAYDLYSGPREEIIRQWKNREFDVLINAGIFVEGFDHKPIETVIVNLSTTSVNKWLQILGRGSRPSPETDKKFFYILDFGCNADRLGHYRQQREWSLTHAISKNEGIASVKTCPKCQALVIASARFCKYCGFIFEKTKEEKITELVEINYAQHIPQKLNFSKMTFEELDEYAKQRGYKKGFVHRQVYLNWGEKGLKDYAKKHGFHHSWFEHQIKIYKK